MSREIADLDAKIAERQQYAESDNLIGRLVASRELPELLRRREELSASLDSARTAMQNSQPQQNQMRSQIEEVNPLVSFLRDQGFEDIQESAAASGTLRSGGTLQDLSRFNTNLAATVVPQLQQQRFNQLFNLLGLGQNAAVGQGTASLNTATNIGSLLQDRGNNQAVLANTQGEIAGNTLADLAGIYGRYQAEQSVAPTGTATVGSSRNVTGI